MQRERDSVTGLMVIESGRGFHMMLRHRFWLFVQLVVMGAVLVSCARNEQPETKRQPVERTSRDTVPAPDRGHKSFRLPIRVEPRRGDLALRGGTSTIRRSYVTRLDDPYTSNDESNDQPVGHFGTETVTVLSESSGHYYTLDADLDDKTLNRIYFPKGGWVDFPDCELDDDYTGSCEDEEGRTWDVEADVPAQDTSDDESSDDLPEGDGDDGE